jgi:hypothetical protein
MLIFEATSDDVQFLNEIQEAFPENMIVAKSKNFSGSTELIDVIIVLTPTILSSISILMNNMLKHRVSKMELEKNQPSEVTFKYKNDKDEYEIILKSSTISNKDELEEAVVSAMNKIKELQGYE